MDIRFPQRRLKIVLFSVWALLATGGLCAELCKAIFGRSFAEDLVYFFGLSYEQNLPTWYSASLLLLCAVQLLLISQSDTQSASPYRWHWRVLSAAFLYISLDETVTLHEDLSQFFDFGGVLYFGWVIPASIVVLIMGLAYLPFLWHLPSRARRQFVVAGIVFVGGALGVELLLGYWTDLAGSKNLVYGLIDLLEESLEILGVTLFFCALLEYVAGDDELIKIDVGECARAGEEDPR
jgi:hypothetical protein